MVAAGLALLCQAAAAQAASFTRQPDADLPVGRDQVGAPHAEERNGPADPFPGHASRAGTRTPAGRWCSSPPRTWSSSRRCSTLGPAEERKIRVGLTVAPAADGEDLPDLRRGTAPGRGREVGAGRDDANEDGRSRSSCSRPRSPPRPRLKDLAACGRPRVVRPAQHRHGALHAGRRRVSGVSTRRARSSATSRPTRGTCWPAAGAIRTDGARGPLRRHPVVHRRGARARPDR